MRKVPRQQRSRATVDRIVAAGRTVLVEQGYDAFTTNRVAEAAGLSPGSLYQYFPDKGAIIDVVIDRWGDEVSDRVAAALADRVGEGGPGVLPDVMDALVAALESDAALLRVALEELPGSRHSVRRRSLEGRVTDLAEAYLAGALARTTSGDRPGPAAIAWVVVLAAENLAVRWVLDEPRRLSREELVREMTRLAAAYVAAASGEPADHGVVPSAPRGG